MFSFDERQVYSKQAHFSKDFGVPSSLYITVARLGANSGHKDTLGQCQTAVCVMRDFT